MSIGATDAVLGLNNKGFTKGMAEAAEAATETGRVTRKEAEQTAKVQAIASKLATEAITEETRTKIKLLTEVKTANREYFTILDGVKKGLLSEAQGSEAAAAAYQRLTAAKLADVAASKTHAEITDRMAASAVVRGVETGNVGIRAVENTLASIAPAGLLQAAFGVIGPAAALAALYKAGDALEGIREKAVAAGQAFAEAAGTIREKGAVEADTIEITNQKLQDQIDKISGHPNDGLATALLEAKKRADELLPSLQADRKELEALLKEHEVGFFASVLSGASATGKQAANISEDQSQLAIDIRGINDDADAKRLTAKDPKQLAAIESEAAKRRHERYQQDINAATNEQARLRRDVEQSKADAELVARTTGEQAPVLNNDAKISQLDVVKAELLRRQRTGDLQQITVEKQSALGVAEQDKAGKKSGADAQHKAEEARRKAAEAQMKSFENQLAQMKIVQDVTVNDEFDFWQKMLQPAAAYPENLARVQERLGAARQAVGRELDAMLRKLDESNARALAKRAENEREITRQADEQDHQRAEQQARSAEFAARLTEVQQQGADALTTLQAAHAVSTGSISRHDEALIQAAMHTANYRAELQKLADEQRKDAALVKSGDLTPEAAKANQDGREVQRAQIQAKQDQVDLIDQWTAREQTAAGGFISVLDQMSAAGKDYAGMVRSLTESVAGDTNRTILSQLTERHHRGDHLWTGLGHNVATSVAGTALTAGEGWLTTAARQSPMLQGVLSKLGIGGKGKAPTGAKADPIFTKSADAQQALQNYPSGQGSQMSTSLQSILAAMGTSGMSTPSPSSGAGSSVASIAMQVLPFIPGFADGVNNFGGGMAWVGEQGPELVHLPSGSSVTPNKQSMAMAGGTTHHHHITINAPNATDPAQVRAQVNLAITQRTNELNRSAEAHRIDQKRRSTQPTR